MGYVAPGALDARAAEALTEYARSWPGEITVVTGQPEEPGPGFEVIRTDDVAATVARQHFDVVGALHRPEYDYLARLAPTVYTAEFDRRIRTEQLGLGASGIDRARIRLGQSRVERVYRRMVRRAAGVQCNGWAAWEAYGSLNAHSLRFADHRMRESDLRAARDRPTWDGSSALRVAFSGRLTAVKGAPAVIQVARRLPHIDFVMLGTGDLADSLREAAPANVEFRGFVPFEEWKPYVRENVDVALLPHPQGDPSCTYFEMLGSGVPIVGRHNATWTRLSEYGAGWAERDIDGIVRTLGRLTPDDLDTARPIGLAMVSPYEQVAKMRVEHLVAAAEASESALVPSPV